MERSKELDTAMAMRKVVYRSAGVLSVIAAILVFPPTSYAFLLGTTTFETKNFGVRQVPDSFALFFDAGDGSPTELGVAYPLEARLILPQSTGTTVFDANDPGFTTAAGLLTDGAISIFGLVWEDPGGASFNEEYDCSAFLGTCSGKKDFLGDIITSILVNITAYDVDTPGHDPNGDGIWTDYHEVRATVSVFGASAAPEPGVLALLGIGLLGIFGSRVAVHVTGRQGF